jgi:hypothetical protein
MIEILVLGTGDRIMLVKRAREVLEKLGIQVDVQDTVQFLFPWRKLILEKCGEFVQFVTGGGEECRCRIARSRVHG